MQFNYQTQKFEPKANQLTAIIDLVGAASLP